MAHNDTKPSLIFKFGLTTDETSVCDYGQSSKSTSCSSDYLVENIVCNVKSNEEKDDVDLSQSLVQTLSIRTIDLTLEQKQEQLECDEGGIIQQDKNLAQALSINLDEPRPSPIVYTNFLRDYARRNLELVQDIERKFSLHVRLTEYYGHATRHVHGLKLHVSLKPMHTDEDRLIHALAPYRGGPSHPTLGGRSEIFWSKM